MELERESKNPVRLTVDITKELHSEVKSRAARRNITIKKWIIRVIVEAIKKEQQYE